MGVLAQIVNENDQIAELIASGEPVAGIAEKLKLNLRTVYRRLEHPDVIARVREIRQVVVDGAMGRMTAAIGLAADTLRELLGDDSSAVRLQAAKTILDMFCRNGGRDVVVNSVSLHITPERQAQDRELFLIALRESGIGVGPLVVENSPPVETDSPSQVSDSA